MCIDRNSAALQECAFELRRFQESAGRIPIEIMKNTKFMLIDFAVIAAVGLLSGCAMAPLKGGHATTSGAIGQTVVQGDNPAQVSRQDQETVKTRSYTVPAGSRLVSSQQPGGGCQRADARRRA